MTPVNDSPLSDHSVWSEILYLDPDFENHNHTWGKWTTRRKQIIAGLIVIGALASVIILRCVHLIPSLMN